jgi:transposase-like protein
MSKHRSHGVEFKRQVAQEYLGGETLHGLSKRHDVSRNLIRVWVEKYEAGAFTRTPGRLTSSRRTRRASPRSSAWSASRPWSLSF